MGLSGDDLKMCQDSIANYIPKIMKHIFTGFTKEKKAQNVCHHVFKVCPKPEVNLEGCMGGCGPGCHCHCSSGNVCRCRCHKTPRFEMKYLILIINFFKVLI